MVAHITTVTPGTELGALRLTEMADALGAIGFRSQQTRKRVSFTSEVVEAQAVKAYLRGHGFRDPEFQIVLEYSRLWGVM